MFRSAVVATILTGVYINACPYLDSLKKEQSTESIENEDKSNWSRFLLSDTESLQSRLPPKGTTKLQICTAYKSLKAMYHAAYPPDTDILGQSDIVGKAVRLAFHDAGEYDRRSTDTLGMDGCLSSSVQNKGLVEADGIVATVFEPMYKKLINISKADFIAMLGKIAIERAATASIKIPFYYGRADNAQCEGGKERLAGAQNPEVDFNRVFLTQLGFSTREAVTLLGAHTVGHVHNEFTGYGVPGKQTDPLTNAFDETPNKFDNNYYDVNINEPWINLITVAGSRNEWLVDEPGHPRTTFTNTDMFIAFPLDTTGPGNTGKNGQLCEESGCSANNAGQRKNILPATVNQVREYLAGGFLFIANGNQKFHNDFSNAYKKLTTLGYALPLLDSELLGPFGSGKMGGLRYVDLERC